MTGAIIFDPLLPWATVALIAALAAAMVGLALWRGLGGWWLRGLAALALLAALANPSFQQEERAPLSDIVLVVVDESASQGISDRGRQTEAAFDQLSAALSAAQQWLADQPSCAAG